jgi:hypothetical protein
MKVGPAQPGGMQAGIACSLHVQRQVVTHVQHPRRLDTRLSASVLEDPGVRLADAKLVRGDAHVEVTADADTVDIGIAIGDYQQLVARLPELQDLLDFLVQGHPLAAVEEDVESTHRQRLVVAAFAQRLAQRLQPQPPHVMGAVGIGHRDQQADLPHPVDGTDRGSGRRPLHQPLVHVLLRLEQGRQHRPERVVQVERNRLDLIGARQPGSRSHPVTCRRRHASSTS